MPSYNSVVEALGALVDRTKGPSADAVIGAGSLTAAAAGAVVADTGPLAAGTYKVEVELGFSGTVVAGKHIVAEHRDAANTGTLRLLALCPSSQTGHYVADRVVIATNERIRAVNGVVGLAGEVAQASIRAYLLPA